MRSQKQIIDRALTSSKNDPLGFEYIEYIHALTIESVKKLRGTLVREDADLSEFNRKFVRDADIRKQCIEYMPFAWEKANGFRGISAARSLLHYKAWLWMMGRDDFDDLDDYQFYGKDHLRRICAYLGLDADKWDDHVRLNSEP